MTILFFLSIKNYVKRLKIERKLFFDFCWNGKIISKTRSRGTSISDDIQKGNRPSGRSRALKINTLMTAFCPTYQCQVLYFNVAMKQLLLPLGLPKFLSISQNRFDRKLMKKSSSFFRWISSAAASTNVFIWNCGHLITNCFTVLIEKTIFCEFFLAILVSI